MSRPPVDTGLLADCWEWTERFVVLTDEQMLVVLLWVFHTHCLEAVPQTPYLAVTSPEKQCGKSRLIESVELLVARPWLAVLPSEAVLYRTVSRAQPPTLLMDEVDAIFGLGRSSDRYEGQRALLNAGHRRGAMVPRCVGATQQVLEFKVFCAKLISGIGTLPDTISDRSVPIRMERRTRREPLERFRRRDEEPVAAALKERIEAWAAENMPALVDARPDMPDELNDRMQEGCEPLVAIADLLAYGQEARAALVSLCTGERPDNVESVRLRLLRDIRTVFEQRERERGGRIKGMWTSRLVRRLKDLDESEWKTYYGRGLEMGDLSKLLVQYKLHSTSIRIGKKVNKGYKRDELVTVWERYL